MEDVWKEAVSSFSSSKNGGKLGPKLWAVLQRQSDPKALLQALRDAGAKSKEATPLRSPASTAEHR